MKKRNQNTGISGLGRANLPSALLAIGLLLGGGAAHAAEPIDGSNPACDDLRVHVNLLVGQPEVFDASDEGWVWVQANRPGLPKFREVSGLVIRSRVATVDYPTTHDTHDQNTVLIIDPGQEDILSNGIRIDPDLGIREFEIEWETGIRPSEKSGDGADPYYPRTMWAVAGDRFWAEGHWIFDCGHTNPDDPGKYPTEIHPPRAAAAMHQTSYPLYATGATPVPVTMTDLYIHGRGGRVTAVLNCGMLDTVGGGNSCPTDTTPIDKDFTFNVCLPVRPAEEAVLTWLVQPGAGNTLSRELQVEEVPATSICANSGDRPLDMGTMLRVTAPLANSGAVPEDVYSRQLIAGWVFPPDPPLRHVQVELRKMILHDDQDLGGTSGELSFFWMNLDADPEPWRRLSDYDIPTDDDSSLVCLGDHTNVLEDYDDEQTCGNGELRFAGPRYDFYVGNGESYTVRTVGWDQDCFDDFFGEYDNFVQTSVSCRINPINLTEAGKNDDLGRIESRFGPHDQPAYGIGGAGLELPAENGDYQLFVDISERALDAEDSADLSVTMPCFFDGEVLVVGDPLTCNVRGANDLGPGLPRGVALDVTANPAVTLIQPATFTLTVPHNVGVNNDSESAACNPPAHGTLNCPVGTVPSGGTATVPVSVVPTVPGTLTTRVDISTTSTDATSSNNSAQYSTEAYRGVTLVIRPSDGGLKNLKTSGLIPVGILSVPGFDATQVDLATLCFGDAEAPAERDCTEAHAMVHVQDLDKDRDLDVLLHYETAQVGIDEADTTACLIGRLKDGSGIYGCAALPPVK